jgi:hypothetical protein
MIVANPSTELQKLLPKAKVLDTATAKESPSKTSTVKEEDQKLESDCTGDSVDAQEPAATEEDSAQVPQMPENSSVALSLSQELPLPAHDVSVQEDSTYRLPQSFISTSMTPDITSDSQTTTSQTSDTPPQSPPHEAHEVSMEHNA